MNEKTIETQSIYKGKVLGLRVDTIELANGGISQREIVEHGESVVVAPLDTNGNVILVKQYRKAAEAILLEAPAGGIEDGEAPSEAASREMQEEIGFRPGNLTSVGGFWLAPGFCEEYMHAFIATDLEASLLPADQDENLEVVYVSLDEVMSMINTGIIKDAKSIAVLLMCLNIHLPRL